MPLPAIAAVAARMGAKTARGAGKALKKGRPNLGGNSESTEKPKAMSPEGIFMLGLAGVIELINILIGFLDFALGIGVFLGPIFNAAGTILIGGWLWLRFKKLPIKKGLLPLALNSIPFLKFFPFWWLLSVGTSLDWKNTPRPQSKEKQVPLPNTQKMRAAPAH